MADYAQDSSIFHNISINRKQKVWIEPMMPVDLEAVKVIEDASFEHPWSISAFERELNENKFACYFVARQGEQIIGYGGLWNILDESHITTLAVAPDFRGVGLGKDILVYMIDFARSRGIKRMTLEVRTGNQSALSLYTSVGFYEVGIRKRYYVTEDALIMWLELDGRETNE